MEAASGAGAGGTTTTPARQRLRRAYGLMERMVRAPPEVLEASQAAFTFFQDRYQAPWRRGDEDEGGKKAPEDDHKLRSHDGPQDWLFLLRVRGFCCELRVSLEELPLLEELGEALREPVPAAASSRARPRATRNRAPTGAST